MEREHVTPFLYRRPERFALANWGSGLDLGDQRWTVDTADDMTFIRDVVARVGDRHASWEQMLLIVGRHEARPADDGVALRAAMIDDSSQLLAWRNDDAAVRSSTSGTMVSQHDHDRWFAGVINNPGYRVRIAMSGDVSVGYVRVDVREGVGTVSIAVDPAQRGKGYAAKILQAMVEDCKADCQVTELIAEVKRTNTASLRAFAAVGFTAVHPTCDADRELQELRKAS